MKIEAQETKNVTVEINDDEIYKIVKTKILELYDLPWEAEIRDGILYRVWMEDFGPYDPEEMKARIRVASDDDINACAVLARLKADYKGFYE